MQGLIENVELTAYNAITFPYCTIVEEQVGE